MRIRKFMVIGVLFIVIFPWFVYFFVHMLDGSVASTQSQQQAAMTQMTHLIIQDEQKWTDPSWQHQLQTELTAKGINAVILSPSNQVIFGDTHHHGWMPSQQMLVVQNGQIAGTIQWYAAGHGDTIAAIAALVALVLGITLVGFQIRRNVIRPLEAMSRAARQIAEGDLDFALPMSRVTEITQVRTAFQVMVKGLRAAFDQQAKLEEERRFFIGAIAHDLRTPLFSLRGYLDGLAQGIAATPAKVAKYVAVCQEKANHLDRLVSDLFAFTKLEYMEQTVHRDRLHMAKVVKRVAESLHPLADAKDIQLHLVVPDKDLLVTGDAHLLERALTNLLDNALRHTPQGGDIFVQLRQDPDKTMLTVRDTGPGFSDEELAHVFEPMYRGDASRNLATGGAGLGLTIAKRIFKSHQGDLLAANHADGGAVLTCWIANE